MDAIAHCVAILLGFVIGASLSRRTVKLRFEDVEIEAPTRKEAEILLDAAISVRRRERKQCDGKPSVPNPQPLA